MRSDKKVVLRSPTVIAQEPVCLWFFAKMYELLDADIGNLTVTEIDATTGNRVELLHKQGSQGNNWFDNSVILPSGRAFKVKCVFCSLSQQEYS